MKFTKKCEICYGFTQIHKNRKIGKLLCTKCRRHKRLYPDCNKIGTRHFHLSLIPRKHKLNNYHKNTDDTITIFAKSRGKKFEILIDEQDAKLILSLTWSICRVPYNTTSYNYYAVSCIKGKLKTLHKFLLTKPLEIDHINHNDLDNRRSNLRYCTHQQNSFNMKLKKNNKTGFAGVFKSKISNKCNRHDAYITMNNKQIYLGSGTLEEAVKLRKRGEIKYFGKFAPT